MEAASIPAGPPASQRIKALIGTYGLLAVLLALPVVYAISDLANDGNLVRLGENMTAGISNGAIWALVAIGYTLVYGIVELINFAHGEVFMIGSFISAGFFVIDRFDRRRERALAVRRAAADAGRGDDRLRNAQRDDRAGRLQTLARRPKLAPLITAVGFSFILQNVGLLWKGGSQQGIPDLINAQHTLVTIFGVTIENADVLSIAVTVPLLLVMTAFIGQVAARQGDAGHGAGS